MLSKIKELFQTDSETADRQPLSEAQRRLACAALMIEVAVIDRQFDRRELAMLRKILAETFSIEDGEMDELIQTAESESADSTSMYQFTQLINNHCTPEQKFDLITGMWRIALSDGNLDKYEEFIIRKSADLIHLPHADFIRAKHIARSTRA